MSPAPAAPPEPAVEAREAAPAPRATRPLYWSVRRELWENRSIHLAPLGVAAFTVAALVTHGVTMPSHMPGLLANDPANPDSALVTYRVAAMLMLITLFVTAAFYCTDALSGERRDRSILFWKSLPVSDRTTVLAKAIVPLVVLPLLTFAAIVAIHLALLLLSAVALLVQGFSVAPLWRALHLFRTWGALLYALAAMALWHAPIYGFLLLVSGWARRTAGLWAVLPLLALGVIEKLTMDTMRVAALVAHALIGWYGAAFAPAAREHIPFEPATALTPGRLLATPWLWIGLALAVVLVAAAVRLRRYRAPG
jgi:ABC-2 type transport system permease protein